MAAQLCVLNLWTVNCIDEELSVSAVMVIQAQRNPIIASGDLWVHLLLVKGVLI